MKFDKTLIDNIKASRLIEDVAKEFISNEFPWNDHGDRIQSHHHVWNHDSEPGTALHINKDMQSFYCFSCQTGGDVITFTQSMLFGDDFERRNWDQFKEALNYLSNDDIQCEQFDEDYEKLRVFYGIYDSFIQLCKIRNDHDKIDLFEEVNKRYPLTQESIDKFRIVLFKTEWTEWILKGLLNYYSKAEIIDSKLFYSYNSQGYCIFDDRLIIPYLQNGEVVYLIGRSIETTVSDNKFKKLPVTDIVKNEYIFGLNTLKEKQEVIITEGIGDCLALLDRGYRSISPVTVAFRNEDFESISYKLSKTKCVYICNDDEVSGAGKRGALKMAYHFLKKGIITKFIELNRQEKSKIDVADYFRDHSTEDFNQLIKDATSPLDTALNEISEDSTKEELIEVWELIANHEDMFREKYALKLAKQSGLKTTKKLFAMIGDRIKGEVSQEMIFEDTVSIVPALDFKREDNIYNSYLTQYIPIKIDGKLNSIPHLLTVTTGPETREVELRNLADNPLNPKEQERLPNRDIIEGRWRLSQQFPYSLGSFLSTKDPLIPDIKTIYDDIYGIFDDYFWYPNNIEKVVLTLYIFLSYFYQIFSTCPGLHLTGPRAAGKTNATKVFSLLAFNVLDVVSVTPALLYRGCHRDRGLLIIDEFEKFTGEKLSEGAEEILGLLRSRYKKGVSTARQEKTGERFETKMYDTYGPLILGSIAQTQDVLASRLIMVECLPKNKAIHIKNFTDDFDEIEEKCLNIRDKLYTLCLLESHNIIKAHELVKKDPKYKEIFDREREKWLPILTIAHWLDLHVSKNTKFKLTDQLIAAQIEKEELKRIYEALTNNELIVLETIKGLLLSTTGASVNFKILKIENENYSLPAEGFYAKMNEILQMAQIIRKNDMHLRSYFDNILRKTHVWTMKDGFVEKGRLTINMNQLNEAIDRLKGI